MDELRRDEICGGKAKMNGKPNILKWVVGD